MNNDNDSNNNNSNNSKSLKGTGTINQTMPSFYPLEINGTKYLICKLPDQPFSTLHDPETKQIVGQWNNDAAQYEIFPLMPVVSAPCSPPPV